MKGSFIWNLQRYSSLVIFSYLIYIAYFILSSGFKINFFEWSNFFLSFQTRFFTTISFFFIVGHAYIGLWTVGTDYLTERTIGFLSKPLSKFANIMNKIYFFAFVLLGIMYLFVILYIIWL